MREFWALALEGAKLIPGADKTESKHYSLNVAHEESFTFGDQNVMEEQLHDLISSRTTLAQRTNGNQVQDTHITASYSFGPGVFSGCRNLTTPYITC
jgi:hypothetical protein